MSVGTGPSPSSSPQRGVLPRWVTLAYGVGAGRWSIVDRVVLTWPYDWYVTTRTEAAS